MRTVLLIILCFLVYPLIAAAPGKGSVTGKIISRLPEKINIEGTYVSLLKDGKEIRTVITDYSGKYEFAGLAAGAYTLEASNPFQFIGAYKAGFYIPEGKAVTQDIVLKQEARPVPLPGKVTHRGDKRLLKSKSRIATDEAKPEAVPAPPMELREDAPFPTLEKEVITRDREDDALIKMTYKATTGSTAAPGYHTPMPASTGESAPAEDIAKPADPAAPGPIFEWDKPKRGGVMTAGERSDLDRWDEWIRIMDSIPAYLRPYIGAPGKQERVAMKLKGSDGNPLTDVHVWLQDPQGNPLCHGFTDAGGQIQLVPGKGIGKGYRMKALVGKKTIDLGAVPGPDGNQEKTIESSAPRVRSNNVDIMFAVDATGSMGDEMDFLKAELQDVIERVKDEAGELNIRLGSVYYRDKTDAYVTRTFPFTKDVPGMIRNMSAQTADGGGDFEEAVDQALENAVFHQEWSTEARTRLLFLILDAPPHTDAESRARMQAAVDEAARKGIHIIPVTASGCDKLTEYMMRAIAVRTQGTYVFITDHSGVGEKHLEPSVKDYKVEFLNDLMVRLILKYVKG